MTPHVLPTNPGLFRSERQAESQARQYGRSKHTVDRILAIMMLVPALLVIAILWALVKLTSRGPGIYKQRRAGLRGREFFIFKLRTMTHNCEQATGAVWAQRNDARITPLGKILRKTHLDELPQLFNVLLGDMSLVGPRPERPEIIEKLLPQIPDYLDRLDIRPGVTGLAQIFADSDISIEDVRRKLRYDKRYIATKSLWLDLRIIFCTALKMIGMNRSGIRGLLFPSVVDVTVNSHRRIDQPKSASQAICLGQDCPAR